MTSSPPQIPSFASSPHSRLGTLSQQSKRPLSAQIRKKTAKEPNHIQGTPLSLRKAKLGLKSAAALPVASITDSDTPAVASQLQITTNQSNDHPVTKPSKKRKKTTLFMNSKRMSDSNRGTLASAIVRKSYQNGGGTSLSSDTTNKASYPQASRSTPATTHFDAAVALPSSDSTLRYRSDALIGRYLSSSGQQRSTTPLSSSLGGMSHRKHVPQNPAGPPNDASSLRGVAMVGVSSMRRKHELESSSLGGVDHTKATTNHLMDLDKDPEEAKVMQKYIANLLFSKSSVERNGRKRTQGGLVGGKRRPQSALGLRHRERSRSPISHSEHNLDSVLVTSNIGSPKNAAARMAASTTAEHLESPTLRERPASAQARFAKSRSNTHDTTTQKRPTSALLTPSSNFTSMHPVPPSHSTVSIQNYEKYLQQSRPKSFQQAYFETLFRKRTHQKLSETYRTGAESPTKRQRRQEREQQLAMMDLKIEVPSSNHFSTRPAGAMTGARSRPQSAMLRRPHSSMGFTHRGDISPGSPEFIVQSAGIRRPHSSMATTHDATGSYDNLDMISTVNTSPQGMNMALEMTKAFRDSPIRRQRPQSAHAQTRHKSKVVAEHQDSEPSLQPKVEPLKPSPAAASNVKIVKRSLAVEGSRATMSVSVNSNHSEQSPPLETDQRWTQHLTLTEASPNKSTSDDVAEDETLQSPPSYPRSTPQKSPSEQYSTPKVNTPEPSTYMLSNPSTAVTGFSPSGTPVWKRETSHHDNSDFKHAEEIAQFLAPLRDPATFVESAVNLLNLIIPSKEYSQAANQNKQLMELIMGKFLQITDADDAEKLILLIKLLAQMCHDSTQNRLIFKQHSGVRKVIDCLENFARVTANTSDWVQFVKNVFQMDFTLQMDFRLGGGIEKLVSLIRERIHGGDPAQVGIFIHSLISVIFHNAENLSCFIENDGIQVILMFFEAGNSLVHEYAGVCLASLARENPPLKTVLAEMKAVQAYIRVLKRSPTEQVVRSCGHICASSPKNQETFVERKGVEVLYEMLMNWRQHSAVVLRRVLVTLSTVCKSNKMALNYVHRTNGFRPIMSAMTGCEGCRAVGALTVSVLVETHSKNQTSFANLIPPMLSYLQSIQHIDEDTAELITNFSLCLRSLCLNHSKNIAMLRKYANTRAIVDLEKRLEPNSEQYFHLDMLTRMISTM